MYWRYILQTRNRLCNVMWIWLIIFSGKIFIFRSQLYRNVDHNLRRNKYNVSKIVVNLQVIKTSNNIEIYLNVEKEKQVTNSKRHHNCETEVSSLSSWRIDLSGNSTLCIQIVIVIFSEWCNLIEYETNNRQ